MKITDHVVTEKNDDQVTGEAYWGIDGCGKTLDGYASSERTTNGQRVADMRHRAPEFMAESAE